MSEQVDIAALPSLLGALSRPEFHYRDDITCWLAADTFDFGTNINSAAPVLVRLAQDPAPTVAINSIKALGRMSTNLELVLPALTNALTRPHRVARFEAVRSIGRLPGSKTIAASGLSAALADPDEATRREATNVLRQIAPDLLTNAPTQ